MRYCLLVIIALLLPVLTSAATPPTTMQIVDLRGIAGQPELDTWLGSLQGLANRQDSPTIAYLVRNDADAELATAFIRMYHLKKESFTYGAFLAAMKPSLTGQVLYSAAEPWTRDIALTAAAVADGMVIATDADLGLHTVLDLRNRWKDRRAAYAWARKEYGEKVETGTCVLAPESGHLLADLIVSRKLLAVDLSPTDAEENTDLRGIIDGLPAGGRLLGSPDNRCGDPDAALWALLQLFGGQDRTLVPARWSANLSCLARFAISRPILQGRLEAGFGETASSVVFIYDGGRNMSGSQSLDYAAQLLPTLLGDPALSNLPVGIEVPEAVLDYAPGLYQLLIARQRMTAAELIAAPNGNGWALPMSLRDPQSYVMQSALSAAAMDLRSLSFFDAGGKEAYGKFLGNLAAAGWQGAFAYPIATDWLADKQARDIRLLPRFAGLVGATRVRTPAELRSVLGKLTNPFNVVYLDPLGIPPAVLRNYLPEITNGHTLLSPSQALRGITEYYALVVHLRAQQQANVKTPGRKKPTLTVDKPMTTLAAPTADVPIPISVHVAGTAPVLVARLVYTTARGVGAADLQDAGNGNWKALIPPTLAGGTVSVYARVIERDGLGMSVSEPLNIEIPIIDSDKDGLEDTMEAYLGTDPHDPDTDHDGLPDGFDPDPLHPNADTANLLPSIFAPTDKPWLADAGASTTDAAGRHVPAGGAVTYRLPLQQMPAAPGAVHLITVGTGTAALNANAPVALTKSVDTLAVTDVPVTTEQMAGKELTVKLTAGDAPLVVFSLTLINNPKGPYLSPVSLSPPTPPAGEPIVATATVYTKNTLKSVRLRYGPDLAHLKTLEMGHLEDTAGAVFAETIPPQEGGTFLLYGVEAEDTEGNLSAGPFQVVPVGISHRPSITLVGSRDLRGSWNATPIWGSYGRSLVKGSGEDRVRLYPRIARHYLWLLAQPTERAIRVKAVRNATLTTDEAVLMDKTVAAGNGSGWYRLGYVDYRFETTYGIDITVTPVGDEGLCAYGMLVMTQDEFFQPPLANAGIDWFNTLTVSGISNGDAVKDAIRLKVLPTGNIDVIHVTAKQRKAYADTFILEDLEFKKQPDGRYLLSAREMPPGEYDVTAQGLKLVKVNGQTKTFPIVTVTVHVIVPNP